MDTHTSRQYWISTIQLWIQLDMLTSRRRLKSPRSPSGTSAHPTMVTQVNIMVMNGWLASFSFIVNRLPHSWDKAITDSDLETPRSRSWVWSKGKVIQLAQYHINSLPFHLTSISPTILQIERFRNLILKHPKWRSWGRSKVKVTYCTQYATNAFPFRFTSIGWDKAISDSDLETARSRSWVWSKGKVIQLAQYHIVMFGIFRICIRSANFVWQIGECSGNHSMWMLRELLSAHKRSIVSFQSFWLFVWP